MTKYVQKVSLLGRERWIGWEIDGIGTDVPGMTLAEEIPEDELRAHGVREYRPMPFETFVELGASIGGRRDELHDRDIEFRLDALQVGMECARNRGIDAVPVDALLAIFGTRRQLAHPRVQERLRQWQSAGSVELVGNDDCYLRIVAPLVT